MQRKPAKNWTWKRLAGERRLSPVTARRPDTMTNARGQVVRFHAAHPILPAIERFAAMLRRQGDCLIFTGGDTFYVDESQTTTPRRFAYTLLTGEQLTGDDLIFATCKTPHCVSIAHMEKRRKRSALPDKVL